MMVTVEALATQVSLTRACAVLQVPRSTLYRLRQPAGEATVPGAVNSHRALSALEKQAVRDVLNSPRFQDQAPREVYATLLDEQQSISVSLAHHVSDSG
jgi:putative transposase